MESLDCFRAKINYHRADDLKEGSPLNNEHVLIQAHWQQHEDESFPNEWVFGLSRYRGWLPERDLVIIEEITEDEYIEDKTNQPS